MSDDKKKVVLLPCPHCGKQCADLIIDQGDKWAHYSASCLEVRTGYNISDDAPWRDYAIAAWNTRQPTQSDALREALEDLLHAVCGEKGFAEAVRRDSGRIYPWPALDLAEAKAIAALDQSK